MREYIILIAISLASCGATPLYKFARTKSKIWTLTYAKYG